MQETSNPQLWDQIWSGPDQEECDRDFWNWVNRESASIRNGKIRQYISNYVGDLQGLKVIEVGSGLGVYSFLFARLGADLVFLGVKGE